MRIRVGRLEDLSQIFAIYDQEVLFGTATFDTQLYSEDARLAWFEKHQHPKYPVLVACIDDSILGWAAISPWSDRCAYARAAEISTYVHLNRRGHGVGRALLTTLIEQARDAGIAVLLARITSESVASLRLHESLGFHHLGTMRRVGEKFGRVLDVELFDLHLDGG